MPTTSEVQAAVDEVFDGLKVSERPFRGWVVRVPGWGTFEVGLHGHVSLLDDEGVAYARFETRARASLPETLRLVQTQILQDLKLAAQACRFKVVP